MHGAARGWRREHGGVAKARPWPAIRDVWTWICNVGDAGIGRSLPPPPPMLSFSEPPLRRWGKINGRPKTTLSYAEGHASEDAGGVWACFYLRTPPVYMQISCLYRVGSILGQFGGRCSVDLTAIWGRMFALFVGRVW